MISFLWGFLFRAGTLLLLPFISFLNSLQVIKLSIYSYLLRVSSFLMFVADSKAFVALVAPFLEPNSVLLSPPLMFSH